MKKLLLFISLLFCMNMYGQDTLLLLNGKQFEGSMVDTTTYPITFSVQKGENKYKLKSFYPDEIFSITYGSGEEQFYYYDDPVFEMDYAVQDMKYVVLGSRDARNGYKTTWVFPLGVVLTGAAAYLMDGNVLSLLLPVVYTGLVQIPIVKVQKKSVSSPEFIGNGFYMEGYNRRARSKRTKHALISALIGTASGIILYEAIN